MAKKFIPKPTVLGAIAVVQHILANEEVRKRLLAAPASVMDWAAAQRTQHGHKFDPTQRFGHKSLERRVAALSEVTDRAFPDPMSPGRTELTQALEGLRVALVVAKPMPMLQRKKAHRRIDQQLDQLEAAMVDAVLAPGAERPTKNVRELPH